MESTELPACLPLCKTEGTSHSAACYTVVLDQYCLNSWVDSELENEKTQNREDRDRGQSSRFF